MRLLMRAVTAAALAGLLFGGAMRAEDKKDDKKPEEKKKDRPAPEVMPDIEKLLEALGNQRGLNDEQLKELREQMKKMRQQMLRQMQKGGFQGGGFGGFGGLQMFPAIPNLPDARRESSQEARLGVKVVEPSAALIDQLDLPKGQGMVLEEVSKDSPAGKAGLKAHDVLLEINGKAVPAKKDELDKVLRGVEGGKAVKVVVLRKGKKETFEGLKLEEAKPRIGQQQGGDDGQMQIQRNNDEFEATSTKDGVKITVSGKVKEGKAEASDIVIRTDGKSRTYESVDKVPAEHQEAVKRLLEKSGGKGLQFRFGFGKE